MEQYKTCTQCNQTLDLSFYSPSKGGKLGLRANCKPCNAKVTAKYRKSNPNYVKNANRAYRLANPEKVKLSNKLYKERNPDYAKNYHAKNREAENARGRKRYWQDPLRQSLRKKKSRLENPEKYRDQNRRYAAKNQDKLNEKAQRRRANKANAKTFKVSKRELWHLYNDKCIYCGNPSETIEHVVPISRGGSHGVGNLAPCCGPCNYSKAGRTIMEWRIWKKRLGL